MAPAYEEMTIREDNLITAAGTRLAQPANEVAVWVRETATLSTSDLTAMDALLSEDERDRRDRFVFARDRRDYTAAHALLRTVLSRYGDLSPHKWRFQTNRFGKPSLVDSQAAKGALAFNLSHTAGLVACAVTSGSRIGIDVEQCDRVNDCLALASHYFTPDECALLSACSREQLNTRFIELWTLKESYIKAVGVGLTLPLNAFGFSIDDGSALSFSCPGDATAWQFWLAEVAAARVAIAVPQGGAPFRITFHSCGSDTAAVTLLRSTAQT